MYIILVIQRVSRVTSLSSDWLLTSETSFQEMLIIFLAAVVHLIRRCNKCSDNHLNKVAKSCHNGPNIDSQRYCVNQETQRLFIHISCPKGLKIFLNSDTILERQFFRSTPWTQIYLPPLSVDFLSW